MKRFFIALAFIASAFSSFSQALDRFNGSLLVLGVNSQPPQIADYRISALFGDARGNYSGSEVENGDVVFVNSGTQCGIYRIDTIYSSGALFDIEVTDLDNFGLPDGAEAIVTQLTPNNSYPMIPPEGVAPQGNSNTLRTCVLSHFINLVDIPKSGGGGGSASTFLQLLDTPNDYSGQAGKSAVVNNEENGIDFRNLNSNEVTYNQDQDGDGSNELTVEDALNKLIIHGIFNSQTQVINNVPLNGMFITSEQSTFGCGGCLKIRKQ